MPLFFLFPTKRSKKKHHTYTVKYKIIKPSTVPGRRETPIHHQFRYISMSVSIQAQYTGCQVLASIYTKKSWSRILSIGIYTLKMSIINIVFDFACLLPREGWDLWIWHASCACARQMQFNDWCLPRTVVDAFFCSSFKSWARFEWLKKGVKINYKFMYIYIPHRSPFFVYSAQ